MPQLLAQAAIAAAVSIAAGFIARKLSKPKAKADNALTPALTRSSADNLSATVDVGAAHPGLFGHRRVGGKIVLSAKGGTKTYLAIEIAGAPVVAINAVYFNNRLVTIDGSDRVTTSPWSKNGFYSTRVKLYTGAQTTADPWLVAAFPGWSADHVGKKLTYAVIEFDPSVSPTNFDDVFASGVPDITFDVSGFACYDPRNGAHNIADPATWTYSANPSIIKANYLIHVLGMGLSTGQVDWTSASAAADIDDQAVTLAGGGTEPRYQCSALWNTDERHEDVLQRMGATNATGDGVHLVGQKWRVMPSGFATASATIGTGGHAGAGLSFSDTPPLSDLVNGVRGKFCSPVHNFEDRDFPAWQDAAAVTADGREAWLDLDLSFVLSHTQAQRLAKIAYMKGRFGFPASLEAKFDYFDTVADDVIALTDNLADFTAATFRVKSDEVTDEWTIHFDLEYETAAFWDWTAATDEKEFVITDPLLGETGNLQPPGGALVDVNATANLIALQVKFAASPSGGADTYEVVSGVTVLYSGPSATAQSTTVQTGNGSATLSEYKVRAKNSTTGEISIESLINSSIAAGLGQVDGDTEATATHYALAPPATPILTKLFSGSAEIKVLPVAGVRALEIEIWTNTVNDTGTASGLLTAANSGVVTASITGTPGQAKFIWARTKNASGPHYSYFSNPLLVVF